MLQTAKKLQTPAFTPSFVPPIPIKRFHNTSATPKGVDRTGDAKLWKLHDEFCRARAKLAKLDTPLANKGSLSTDHPSARRAFQKWENQLSHADEIARKIAACRANTLDGMLMKIQVLGSIFDWVGKSYVDQPYRSHDSSALWTAYKRGHGGPLAEEEILIESLRDDLLRLHARGGSR